MNRKSQILVLLLILAVVLAGAAFYIFKHPPALLTPKGVIAAKERSLMITATLLMLIVVTPVYVMTFLIVWRYHESNHHARYEPDWDGDRRLEFAWWAVPTLIITILAIVTWNSSHSLDPFKSLSAEPPLKIQVVALQWKWLFIYPKQNIASVNFVQFPEKRPVEFDITSDAPMNSFWIPQLGGQIYAMSGMSTKLNLQASKSGDFEGLSANISGTGFSGMKFIARASSVSDFQSWAQGIKRNQKQLTLAVYDRLSLPSRDQPVVYYGWTEPDLYNKVVMKFMAPGRSKANYDLAQGVLGAAPGGSN